jgi:hypothetical protein
MTRTNWIIAACLGLLLIGGSAFDASAQQPPTPPAPAETPQAPESPTRPAPAPTPQTEYGGQPAQAPPTSSQIETRPASPVGQESTTFLGVDPTVAMVIGAVLVIVIVFGLVAMSRRGDEVVDPHTRHRV